MSSTDNRIVKMQFDNAAFKKEAMATKSALTEVDAAVAKTSGNKGLLSMAGNMDTVRVKAGAMQVAAVTAIANITNRAVNAGITLAKSLTLDPIKAGFDEYELKMKSIQTILANTDGENLKSVTATLDELNDYADKTIYNFGNMTDAIGKMTTAGIDLETATSTVKGFHNMVALAGGDSNAAAGALEQFNQGLQAGVIKLIDWKSLQTRGLGSQALQESFFETAKAAGTLQGVDVDTTFKDWAAANGGFNSTLESGWLTADVATKAYAIMAGEVSTVKDLMKEGFSKEAAKNLLDIAANAEESATKVRTASAFMGTLKEQLGSGWSKVMETIFGDFNEATNLFTKLSDTSGKLIGSMFEGINSLLGGWDKLGGRAAIFTTIQNVISPMAAIFSRIGDAVRLAFGGGKGGSFLATFSKALEHLTRPLNVLGKLIRGQISPMEAFQRVITIIKNAVRNLFEYMGGSLPDFSKIFKLDVPSDGFLGFLKDIGRAIRDAVGGIDNLLNKGSSLAGAFSGIKAKIPGVSDIPDMPDMPSLPSMPSFGGGDSSSIDKMASSVKNLNGEVSGLSFDIPALRGFVGGTEAASSSLDGMAGSAEEAVTVGDRVGPVISKAWDALKEFFQGFNVDDLMASFNLAVLSTFVISMSRFFNSFSKTFVGFAQLGPAVTGMFESVGGSLDKFAGAANKQAWAKIILNVAISIGILAVALWILSKIPADKMVTALAGMAGIMLIMKVGIDAITKAVEAMDGKGTTFKLAGLSLALLALGVAVLMLAGAFLILNYVDWSSMLKGLGTIIVVMTLLERMGKIGEGGAKNLLASAVALTAMAFSLVILAGALLLFKLVDWESLGKAGASLLAMTASLLVLGKLNTETIAKAGGSMALMAVGMLLLANALLIFGQVSWESMLKAGVALGALTISLLIMGAFLKNPVVVTGMVALSAAMIGLATAALIMNKVDWSSIGKLGLVMAILVVAFAAFGAIAYVLSPVLIVLSAFAGSLALLAFAITALTLAFALILPLMAVGIGAFAAFATGAAVAIGVFLTTLALQAPVMKDSILKIMQAVIDTIVEGVPMVIDGIKRLFVAIKNEFTGGGGGGAGGVEASVGKTSQSWMGKITDSIKKKMPEIVSNVVQIGIKFISGLTKYAPKIAAKGAELVIGLINGIASRIGGIVTAAVNLIVAFAGGLGNNIGKLATAGVKLIADFLHGLADGIRAGSGLIGDGIKDVIKAFGSMGLDLVKGLANGITDAAHLAWDAAVALADSLPKWVKKVLGIASPSKVFKSIGKFLVEGLTKGIQDNAASSIVAVASMVSGTISVASEYVDSFVQKLDQQATAAMGKAAGLQAAAARATKAAEKTKKNKKDDRKARGLQDAADRATKAAEKRETRATEAAEQAQRNAEFADSTLIEQAQMRAEDSTNTLDDAKSAELEAVAKREEAAALREQAKKKGISKKDAKAFRAQADALEKQAEAAAGRANTLMERARTQAAEAMSLQSAAAAEAAAGFQTRYNQEAASDAQEDAFNKMTNEEKMVERRRQATELQAQADKDLARAKELAYTDLEAANALAEQAIDDADKARDYLREAADLENTIAQGSGETNAATNSKVVSLETTEAASIAFNRYNDLYSDAAAAAAAGQNVEFNQYNTSPEALPPSEIYRQSNNLLSFAASKLQPAS